MTRDFILLMLPIMGALFGCLLMVIGFLLVGPQEGLGLLPLAGLFFGALSMGAP